MRALSIVLLLVAGCSRTNPPMLIDGGNSAATLAGREAPSTVDAVRAAVRAEANRLASPDCDDVRIPGSAFVPVEVTGGGDPEYAVFFAHATCNAQGVLAASAFTGTGGAQIEFWSGEPAPKLLFRHAMHGFSPTGTGFVSLQHGSACPGGAGPGACLVTYEWTSTGDGFQVQARRLYDDRHPGQPPPSRYDWNYPLPG